jgi:hypothetical protein
VLAPPEGQVRVGVATDVEPERIGEHRLVEVGRGVVEHDPITLADALAADLDVAGRGAAEVVHGSDPTKHLFDGERNLGSILLEGTVGVGVGEQCQEAARQQRSRGLVGGHRDLDGCSRADFPRTSTRGAPAALT